jgi:parallel beta-helix repeat protein
MKKIIFFSLLIIGNFTHAATYYVATNGTNSSTCGSSTSPCLTISYAYAKVVAGDTMIVKSGNYANDFTIQYSDGKQALSLNKVGTASAPITIKSEVRWGAVIDGTGKYSGAIFLNGQYHILDGFTITKGQEGIVLYGSNNKVINNHIYNNGRALEAGAALHPLGQGIYEDNTTGNSYIGNNIHNNGRLDGASHLDHGMYLCGKNTTVVNNLIYNNRSYGLQIRGDYNSYGYNGVGNMKVYNNVFAGNQESGIVIFQQMASVYIKNNIFYKNAHYSITSSGAHGGGVVFDHNLMYGNGLGDKIITDADPQHTTSWLWSDYTFTMGTQYIGDPLFAGATDFHLTAGSSWAIDKGLSLPEANTDYAGTPRPQGGTFDIGAFEFVSGGTPATTKPGTPQNLKVQ